MPDFSKVKRADLIEAATHHFQARAGVRVNHPHPFSQDLENGDTRFKDIAAQLAATPGENIDPRASSRMVWAGMTTSDFGTILANTFKAVIRRGFAADMTHRQLAVPVPINDFRPVQTPDLSAISAETLISTPLGEGGALPPPIALQTATGSVLQLRSWARRLLVSRNVVINDDIDLVVTLIGKLGAALARAERRELLGGLVANPTLPGGVAVFHASHQNDVVSATPFTQEGLGVGFAALRKQPEQPNGEALGLQPKAILLHPDNEAVTRAALWGMGLSDSVDLHFYAGMATDQVIHFADPVIAPVLALGTLAGSDGQPRIEPSRPDFDSDSVSQVVGHDFACGTLSFVGAVRVRVS